MPSRSSVRSRALAAGVVSVALVALVATPALAAIPLTGETQLVSVNTTAGAGGNQSASDLALSQNGRYVAFSSIASDMIVGDLNGLTSDVFRRDLLTGETILVGRSTGPAGLQIDAGSSSPAISADGRFVVFTTVSDVIDPLDTTTSDDVYVRDIDLGTTTLVSVNAAGTAAGNNYSTAPSISPDGSVVAFSSVATDLVAGDTNAHQDVFYRSVSAAIPVTRIASLTSAAGLGDADSGDSPSALSTDGRYIAWESSATNVLPAPTTGYQIYRTDLQTGLIDWVSAGQVGASRYPSLSADASLVAFSTDNGGLEDIYVRSIPAGTTKLVSVPRASGGGTPDDSTEPSIAADGKSVAFESDATNLTDDLVTGDGDIFVASLATGLVSLVSVNSAGTGGGSDTSYGASLSADGTVIGFASRAVDLVALDTSGFTDVFAKGLPSAAAASKPSLASTGDGVSIELGLVAIVALLTGVVLVARRRTVRW